MERIELKLDEQNELSFSVTIEGTKEPVSEIRMICVDEGLSYAFKGVTTGEMNEVKVTVPAMKERLKEGLYETKLEVIVEGRCLTPLQFLTNFKAGVKVVAESVKVIEKSTLSQPVVKASVITKTTPTTVQLATTESIQQPKQAPKHDSKKEDLTLGGIYRSKKSPVK